MKWISLIVFLLTACSASYKSEVKFNPLEPIRLAILPFGQVDKNGEFINSDDGLLIDKVTLVSKDLGESPSSLLRKLVQVELDETALDTLSPSLVDSKLLHTGFANEKLKYDYKKIFNTSATEICTKVLDCDAVLYGKVTRWDRSYYGIQSVTTVGMDIKIISAKSGEVLFSVQVTDSDSRGLTKIPTGFSSLILEPLKGLDNEITIQLAQNVVKKIIKPLQTDQRPEYEENSPPSIYSSAHNAIDGKISHSSHLTVMLVGSPAQQASFSIGNDIQGIPMSERDPGHYVGEYIPLKTDKLDSQPVVVELADKVGRVTAQRLGREVSLY